MTNFGVLGTGVVGQTLATKLIGLGHAVVLGARDAANPKAITWADGAGSAAGHGTFADAAVSADIVINATSGDGALAALDAAGDANLAGKVLIDVSNPLDFAGGFPPSLSVPSTDSLGARIQRAHPQARVVKTLNTVTAAVMVDPSRVPGNHTLFVSGDDEAAKHVVVDLLASFGWPAERVLDLGGIATARAAEAYVLLWVHLLAATGTAEFNISIARA